MTADSICPDCCERLVKDHKKLGRFQNWLICPKCWLRVRRGRLEFDNENELHRLKSIICQTNKTGGFKEPNE